MPEDVPAERYAAPLRAATEAATAWLDGLRERPITLAADIEQVKDALGRDLPDDPEPAVEVVRRLARGVEPGLLAIGSPRFYGWVMGGTQPAALAADWMVSAWDQNSGLRAATPGTVGAEEIAATWVLELLGLPQGADVGFVTGGMMANFTGLAAARQKVLHDAGWDLAERGLAGGPAVRVIVGAERHDTVDVAARLLGLGAAVVVGTDGQGRIDVAELRTVLAQADGPTIVVLQAGNIHSGAFDPFEEAIDAAHAAGAWVHVDGAFGLWAAASPRFAALTAGLARADSWATDSHKTLNVPYDCGIAIVSDPAAMRAAMGHAASYLAATASTDHTDPFDRVPELSRRARGVPTWAALRAMGRSGTIALVERLADAAAALAAGLRMLPGVGVCNDVVFTQVSISLADERRTQALGEVLRSRGEVFASSSWWGGRAVLRFSVSNWATDAAEAQRTVDAVAAALSEVPE